MLSFISTVSVLTLTLCLSSVCAFDPNSNTNLVVYWGQGSGQKTLGEFCQDDTIDIIPIAFVNVFPDDSGSNGYPGTNFGNACSGYFTDSNGVDTQLLASCPQIAEDIVTCQQAGKKILLSLGGASTDVFVKDEQSAIDFANFLWEAFGPVPLTTVANVPRPFGTAVVDGFDFDIESLAADIPSDASISYGYDIMINQLRENFKGCASTFYISGAPQCVVPDAHLSTALHLSNFDWIFVQFYNTPFCSARAHLDHTYGSSNGESTDISYTAWATWAAQNSQNSAVKIYLGLPAAPAGTYGNMYLTPSEALEVTADFFSTPSFGGIMLWEATLSENNVVNGQTYAQNMKSGLLSLAGSPHTTTTTTTISTTSSTTFSFPTSFSFSIPTTFYTSSTSISIPGGQPPSSTPGFPFPTSYTPTSSLTTTTSTSVSYSISQPGFPFPTSQPSLSTTSTTSSTTTTYTTFSVPTPGFPFPTTSMTSYSITTTSSSSPSVPVVPQSSATTPGFPFPTPNYSTSPSYNPSTSISPLSSITTSSSTSPTTSWAWPATTSSPTSPDSTITIITTSYVDICPTGFTTKPWITTLTRPATPTSASLNQCPDGFTTVVTLCTVCGPAPTTVTLTLPLIINTMTVVPIAWSDWTATATPVAATTTTTMQESVSVSWPAWSDPTTATTTTVAATQKSISWPASKAWTTSSKPAPSISWPTTTSSTSTKPAPTLIIPAKSSSSPAAPVIATTDWLTYKLTATAVTMGLDTSTSALPKIITVVPTTTTTTMSTSTVVSIYYPSSSDNVGGEAVTTTMSTSTVVSIYHPSSSSNAGGGDPFNQPFTGGAVAIRIQGAGLVVGWVGVFLGLGLLI